MMLDNTLERRRQRISLTPLIDIVFILLVFFVLETNFIRLSELLLPLPQQDDTPPSTTANRKSVEIQLASASQLWIAGESLSVNEFAESIQQRDWDSDTQIVLACAADVTLQTMVEVIDVLEQNRLGKIRLAALE